MIRSFIVFATLLLLALTAVEAQTSLRVLDPHYNTNYKLPGSIQELTIAVKPRGLYIEYEMYITFNSKGSHWLKSQDTLEVEFYFNLPEKAFLIDSWLWYNDIILKARLLDLWSASKIYEDIVHRIRRDPSVIYRRSAVQYEMRVFPMNGDSYRKVKISYMAPATWSANSVIAELPLYLANTSATKPEKMRIIAYTDKDFTNPVISGNTSGSFQEVLDSSFGHCYELELTPSNKMGNMTVSFDSPMKNGVYANYGYFNDEAIYQMAIIPSQALDFNESRKIVFLVDHNQINSTSTGTVVEEALENLLRNNLFDRDSFNIIFSGLEPKLLSPAWLSGNKDSLKKALDLIDASDVKTYSNLPSLLYSGVDFLNNNGMDGCIFILSSSVSLGEYSIANELITDLLTKMKKKYPVFAADYATKGQPVYTINNINYRGNEYLYTNLGRLTGGTQSSLYQTNDQLPTFFQKAYNTLTTGITNFEFHSSLENGFCYGIFNISGTNPTLNQPVMHVGKSVGEFPLTITASGFIQSKARSKSIKLNEEDISFVKYSNNQIWNANMIRTLENKTTKTNQDILDIIDMSKANRVLSYYTAFLALETDTLDVTHNDTNPDEGDDDNYTLVDESIIVYDNDSYIHLKPNPFSVSTEITISLPGSVNSNILSIEIYDMLGRSIRTIDISGYSGMNDINFRWLGDDNQGNKVQEGSYVLIVTTATRKYSMKILKI